MRISDWSSDVCSSDLLQARCGARPPKLCHRHQGTMGSRSLAVAPRPGHAYIGLAPGCRYLRRFVSIPFVGQPGRGGPGRGAGLCQSVAVSIRGIPRSEEHTSELQSLMRISYAVFCLTKKNTSTIINT